MTKQTNKKEKRKVTPETITKSVSRTLTSSWTFSCELRDGNRKCGDVNEKCRNVYRKCRDVNKKVGMSIKSVVM